MGIKICSECHREFYAEFEWQRICKTCYKEIKQKELNGYKSKINQLEFELNSLKNHKPILTDIKFIKELINLCHPDKHDNSKQSNEVTIRLIQILNDLKRKW